MAYLEVKKGRRVEGSRVVERRVKEIVILYLIWMFLKLVRGKRIISHSSYLDILKIRMEKRGNGLNRQIYLYLKIYLRH